MSDAVSGPGRDAVSHPAGDAGAPASRPLLPVSAHALRQALAEADAHVRRVLALIAASEPPPGDGWGIDVHAGAWVPAAPPVPPP